MSSAPVLADDPESRDPDDVEPAAGGYPMAGTAEASPEFHLEQALIAFTEARDLTDCEAQPGTYGVILHDIAVVHESAGRTSEALDHYREAAAAKRRADNPADLQVTLCVLASRLIDLAELDEAEDLTDEANDLLSRRGIELSRAQRAKRLQDVGRLYERLGDIGRAHAHAKALDSFSWALTLLDPSRDPRSCGSLLRDIGDVQLVIGRVADAVESYRGAVDVLRSCESPQRLTSGLIALGRAEVELARHRLVTQQTGEPGRGRRGRE